MASTHRRPKQIKRAFMMMKNPPVIVGIDRNTPDHRFEYIDSKVLAEWKERYGDRLEVISADWNKKIIVL